MKKDIATLDELMRILESENLTEISYEVEGFKVNLKRPYKSAEKKSVVKPATTKAKIEECQYIELLSQGIGRFYSIDSKVALGSSIKIGDEIGYIVAMGVKNIVTSDVSGKVEQVYIADGDIVDYNRAILKLKK